jgi:glycosyltransferase involved in cell wall biosynthesis
VESLALGTPVIASRVGGLPELIEHHRTGLLFPVGNVEALADCLRWMSRNASDAYEMSMNALVTARERFSPQRHLEQLLKIYDDTVSEFRKTQDMRSDY